MEIQFTGTGGAFDYQFRNSAAIVDFKGENFLIDCGHSVYDALCQKGFVSKVDHVLITHFHADHIGSLPTLILHHHQFVKDKQLNILYPEKKFKNQLYDFLSYALINPEKYIAFYPMEKYDGLGYIDTYGAHIERMQTYSYLFQDGEELLAYSGDLGDCDLLFEELEKIRARKKTVFHDICFNPQLTTHTFYEDLEEYQQDYQIYGYHCDPRQNPDDNRVPLVYNQPEFLL